MITIHVPGKPVAQSRPRFARRGSFVTTYDAAPAKDYKSWVKSCAVEAMAAGGFTIIGRDVPLSLRAVISLERPRSKAKKITQPVTKPDNDNTLKGIQDAMESIVYEADQQIVETYVLKQYASPPGVTITIQEFKDPSDALAKA